MSADSPRFYTTRLAEACLTNDTVRARNALAVQDPVTVDARLYNEWTALHAAVHHGNIEVAQLLLKHGASINKLGGPEDKTPLHMAVEAGSKPLVKLLLDYDADPDKFAVGMTPLHLAVEKGDQEITELLLDAGASIELTTSDEETPLLIAARHGILSMVKLLLSRNAEPDSNSAQSITSPLLQACHGNHYQVAKTLLNYGADIDIKDEEGNTPLFKSVAAGNLKMTELLLKRGATTTITNISGDTPEGVAANNEQILNLLKRRRPLQGPRISDKPGHKGRKRAKTIVPRYLKRPSRDDVHKRQSCRKFQITMVDFYIKDREWSLLATDSVQNVLYRKGPKAILAESRTAANMQGSPNFTWYHIPANNLTWVEHLITRIMSKGNASYADKRERVRMLDERMRSDLSLNNFGSRDNGSTTATPFMKPACHDIPEIGSHDTPQKTLMLVLPFLNLETYASYTKMAATLKRAQQTDEPGNRQPRAPRADNHDNKNTVYTAPRKGYDEALETRATVAKRALSTGHLPPQEHTDDEENKSICSAPAVLTRKETKPALSADSTATESTDNSILGMRWLRNALQQRKHKPNTPDEDLVLGYCNNERSNEGGLQPRQTLDQYVYLHLENIGERDSDQVVYRYTKKEQHSEPKLFMVDQLWMWILDDGTLITCLPRRWDVEGAGQRHDGKPSRAADPDFATQVGFVKGGRGHKHNQSRAGIQKASDGDENDTSPAREDPMDVLQTMLKYLTKTRRPPIKSVHSLATTLVSQCVDLFDHHRLPADLQFFDFFERSIAQIVDNGTTALKDFKEDLEYNRLSNITKETEGLIEVEDIIDELGTLKTILTDQEDTLKTLSNTLGSVNTTVLRRHLARIEAMEQSTKSAENKFFRLIDLKQKQASHLEAAATSRQGNAVVLFTVVTIIFLPISFMAAFFAINIDGFEVAESGKLPLRYVIKYMLGIGLGLSIPFIYIVFNLDTVANALRYKFFSRNIFVIGVMLGAGAILPAIWTSSLSSSIKVTLTVVVVAIICTGCLTLVAGLVKDGVQLVKSSWSTGDSNETVANEKL
ncbi:hypothetical protein VHEMI02142 [[Torrubiella] hemipterigena]|uniref:Uncharacterized protein n=1 Tax=[Torrubiella] hemipterigena TaxID=1531966 RepID=A0A0A1SUY9_9HYPO|nr:hypothetical protein VHEMI02142 [[Torrubiella] hemipterigena]